MTDALGVCHSGYLLPYVPTSLLTLCLPFPFLGYFTPLVDASNTEISIDPLKNLLTTQSIRKSMMSDVRSFLVPLDGPGLFFFLRT